MRALIDDCLCRGSVVNIKENTRRIMGNNMDYKIFETLNNRIKTEILKIGSFCLFLFFIMSKVIFGFAYDTGSVKNCGECHGMRKTQVKPGTLAIRKDLVRGEWRIGEPLCDVCHTNEKKLFNRSDSSGINGERYPSAHPVAVLGMDSSDLAVGYYKYQSVWNSETLVWDTTSSTFYEGGKTIFFCNNCHDAGQLDRGIHSTYVSMFRLRSAGVGLGDPDPSGDTVRISSGQGGPGWFLNRRFDVGYDTDVVVFGLIAHQQSGSFSPGIDLRASKELVDFNTLGYKTLYFCLTCHSSDGFPRDPKNPNDTNRIHPPDYLTYYNFTDGDDSTYDKYGGDGGHVIQGETTLTGLVRGDKLTCLDCHVSHGAKRHQKLLRDDIFWKATAPKTPFTSPVKSAFCFGCHSPAGTSYNRYYSNGQYFKYPYDTASMLPPLYDPNGGRDISSYHSTNSGDRECFGYVDTAGAYQGGCHNDPHRTTMFCGGTCHKDHVAEAQTSGNAFHPNFVTLTSTKEPSEPYSTKEYYTTYADTAEVRLINEQVECLTCHNDHTTTNTPVNDTTNPQMQGMLRGDAGPLETAGWDSVAHNFLTPGVGNNYPEHDTAYNMNLWNLMASKPGAPTWDEFTKMKAMPELCINCHFRVIGIRNNHGGFTKSGFGVCDKCHSIHGRHRQPSDSTKDFDSLTLSLPLHYGVFYEYDKWLLKDDVVSRVEYTKKEYLPFDTLYDTIQVHVDTAGYYFSLRPEKYCLHTKTQTQLCERCHGDTAWVQIVPQSEVTPPQVFFDTGSRYDSLDVYNTALPPFYRGTASKSTHPVDLQQIRLMGASERWSIDMKCSSATNGSGCHNPHGNDNYAQLNSWLYIGSNETKTKWGSAMVNFTGGGTNAYYVNGMHTFCSLCHDRFAYNFYYSTTDNQYYDSARGHYTYSRHPVGPGVSLLKLFPDPADRNQIDSVFFDKLFLDYESTKSYYNSTKYPNHAGYQDFLGAALSDSANNFIVTCVTCHYPHGSPYEHLRKFTDLGVIECVGCHTKSPDLLFQ